MRLLLAISAYGLTMLALLVQPKMSVLVPEAPDHVSYAVHFGTLCVFGSLYLLYVYERRLRPDAYEGRLSAGPFMGAGVALGFLTVAAAPLARDALAGRAIHESEAAAADALARIAAAQQRFRSEDLDSDGEADFAGDLRELVSAEDARRGLPQGLAITLRSPRPMAWRGYYVSPMRGSWAGSFRTSERFGAQAVPAEYGRTGLRTFYVTDSGTVYCRDTGGVPVLIEPRDPAADGWRPAAPGVK